MSEENVEIVRQAVADWNRGDLDAFMDTTDEHTVIRAAEGWPEPVFYGKEAVRSFYEGFAETVGRAGAIEELVDAGPVVVARIRAHMTGEQSGIETDMRFSQVITFRKGKVILVEYFWDHQQALEAAGLSE
jgi:ketosteroid isomerase-like protein